MAKILIVDDSKTALLVNLRAIKKFYPFTKILTAKNGAEALEIIKNNPNIKVIITDYEMPEMDGKSLIKKIREKYDMEEKIIISISSIEEVGLSSTLLKMGANDFLHKPFIEDELLCRIDNNVTTAILIDEMKQMAYKDPLTSLYNRRYFFETAEKLYLTAIREEREIAILMCDIDHFKKINDTYGHLKGDDVLKKLSFTIKESIREHTDTLIRWGGEEFVVVLNNLNDIVIAKKLAEKFRKEVNNIMISEVGHFSCSFGVSCGFVDNKSKIKEILDNADKALYKAKRNGKNRVEVF